MYIFFLLLGYSTATPSSVGTLVTLHLTAVLRTQYVQVITHLIPPKHIIEYFRLGACPVSDLNKSQFMSCKDECLGTEKKNLKGKSHLSLLTSALTYFLAPGCLLWAQSHSAWESVVPDQFLCVFMQVPLHWQVFVTDGGIQTDCGASRTKMWGVYFKHVNLRLPCCERCLSPFSGAGGDSTHAC